MANLHCACFRDTRSCLLMSFFRFYCSYLSLVPEACPAGHFCPLGSSEPRPCPGGTYNPHEEGGGTSACLLCLPGYVCLGEGNAELSLANQCPMGHYCLEGSQQPIPCLPGTYAAERGTTSEHGCKPCPGEASVLGTASYVVVASIMTTDLSSTSTAHGTGLAILLYSASPNCLADPPGGFAEYCLPF